MKQLMKNWDLKLLALGAAILLWFFVVGIENTVYLFPEEIEVKVLNLGNNIGLASPLPGVKVYVKASPDIIKTLNKNSLHAYVDLNALASGQYDLPVNVSSDNSQIVPLQTVPPTIEVKLSPIAQKEVPIEVTSIGNPKEGYVLKEIKIVNKTATISAAQNLLDAIDSVKAEVLLDGTETGQINKDIVLTVAGEQGLPVESIKINPEQITATAVIEVAPVEKSVKVTPQYTDAATNPKLLDSIAVNPSEIMVRGDADKLKNLTEIKTVPVSANDLLKRTIPLEITPILPEGISLSDPSRKITITIDKGKNTRKAVMSAVVIAHENPSFKVKSTTPAAIRVTVSGPPAIIDALGQNDVTVNLNLENINAAGTYPISADEIMAPPGIDIIDFQPKEVTLEAY
jgi:YbbR domain-containing protein